MKKKIVSILASILMLSIFTVVCSAENSTASETGLYIFRPAGDIITQWGPGSGSGYTEVDDITPDETSTYIGTWINGKMDVYSIIPQTVSGIKNITVYGRFITDFVDSKFCLLIYKKSTGSISYSTPIQLTTTGSWQTIYYTWETNPFTGLDWNENDIDDLGIGICADYCAYYGAVFCTQVYLETGISDPNNPEEPGDPSDEEDLEDIIEDVEEMELHKGLKKRLISKLEKILIILEEGRLKAAIKKLMVVIKQVEAQIGKKITVENADKLIASINYVIDDLIEENVKIKRK